MEAAEADALAAKVVDALLNEQDIDDATHGNYDAEIFRIRLRKTWVDRARAVLIQAAPIRQLAPLAPRRPSTHTYAVLEVTRATYDEVERKLRHAGYDHVFQEDRAFGPVIDMHGIALAPWRKKAAGERS